MTKKKETTIKQLRMFAKEVGIKPTGHTRTSLIKAIVSKTKITNQYTVAFMNWYDELDQKFFDKKRKVVKSHLPKLKVFSIDTYSSCTISEENHRKKFICIFPKGDAFEFSIDINHSSFESEFTCIYKNERGQGVLLYRAKPNRHLHKFWTQLGNEYFKRENGYKEAMRNKILDEFNFNWDGNN
jgi:hypothetical protein